MGGVVADGAIGDEGWMNGWLAGTVKERAMKNVLFVTACAVMMMACGGDDGDTSGSGGGGAAATTSSSGATTSGTGGGGGGVANVWNDSCEGVTAKRQEITPEKLLEMLDNKDFELINVHTPYAGEIVGTDTHIHHLDADAQEAYLGGDKTAHVVVYCLTGPMSTIAGDELVKRGYCNVKDMAAGASVWQQLGYPYTP